MSNAGFLKKRGLLILGLVLLGAGAVLHFYGSEPAGSYCSVTPVGRTVITLADGQTVVLSNPADLAPFATVYNGVSPPFTQIQSITFQSGVRVTATAAGTTPSSTSVAWNPTVSFNWSKNLTLGTTLEQQLVARPTNGSVTCVNGVGQVYFNNCTIQASTIEGWAPTTSSAPYYVGCAVKVTLIYAKSPAGQRISGPDVSYTQQVGVTVDKTTYSLYATSATGWYCGTLIGTFSLGVPASLVTLDVGGLSVPVEYVLGVLGAVLVLLSLIFRRR